MLLPVAWLWQQMAGSQHGLCGGPPLQSHHGCDAMSWVLLLIGFGDMSHQYLTMNGQFQKTQWNGVTCVRPVPPPYLSHARSCRTVGCASSTAVRTACVACHPQQHFSCACICIWLALHLSGLEHGHHKAFLVKVADWRRGFAFVLMAGWNTCVRSVFVSEAAGLHSKGCI